MNYQPVKILALAGSRNHSRGWARSISGDTVQGISCDQDGHKRVWRATGAMLYIPFFLSLKAEALHPVDRPSEALEAIRKAEGLAETYRERWWCAELHRLRGVFLTAIGTDEPQIEASFCEAIATAKEQKSISLATRAEATYADYRRQKASASEGRGFRLNLFVDAPTAKTEIRKSKNKTRGTAGALTWMILSGFRDYLADFFGNIWHTCGTLAVLRF